MLKIDATRTNNIDILIRRFKRTLDKKKVSSDYRKNEFYTKPTTRRRAAKMAAEKRQRKKLYKETQSRPKN